MDKRVQLETMRPEELTAACAAVPVAYLPVGATEFHGRHLPVGLDALKAHAMCCAAARTAGGVVLPPVYYGWGGGHADFEWTWMVDRETLLSLLLSTLHGLEKNGVNVIVLMAGHYPNAELFDELAVRFREQGGAARILSLVEHEAFPAAAEYHGDHAAKWETSYMLAIDSALVDMKRLHISPAGKTTDAMPLPAATDPWRWWFEKNPEHPWYGLSAPEHMFPESASAAAGREAIEAIVAWVVSRVNQALAEPA